MSENQTTFQFELVSPEKKLFSQMVWQVVVPGDEGDFGVRAGHASLVSSVRPGIVKVWSAPGADPVEMFVTGGFADVSGENCAVLAEQACEVTELNAETLTQEIADLNEKLAASDLTAPAQKKLRNELDVANAKLRVVSGNAHH